ncbi:hypothetical protein M0802_003146 [Mischocyttarus mexicanus]|nr:hypothetical protein M0802_003146 [Mischocyttarus mexicanus]
MRINDLVSLIKRSMKYQNHRLKRNTKPYNRSSTPFHAGNSTQLGSTDKYRPLHSHYRRISGLNDSLAWADYNLHALNATPKQTFSSYRESAVRITSASVKVSQHP